MLSIIRYYHHTCKGTWGFCTAPKAFTVVTACKIQVTRTCQPLAEVKLVKSTSKLVLFLKNYLLFHSIFILAFLNGSQGGLLPRFILAIALSGRLGKKIVTGTRSSSARAHFVHLARAANILFPLRLLSVLACSWAKANNTFHLLWKSAKNRVR